MKGINGIMVLCYSQYSVCIVNRIRDILIWFIEYEKIYSRWLFYVLCISDLAKSFNESFQVLESMTDDRSYEIY